MNDARLQALAGFIRGQANLTDGHPNKPGPGNVHLNNAEALEVADALDELAFRAGLRPGVDLCDVSHCHCRKEDDGAIYFDGLKLERDATEMFKSRMDKVSWQGCPTPEGFLYLRTGYDHQQIRNIVWHFQVGCGVGVKLGHAEQQAAIRKCLGIVEPAPAGS